jgi:hypothetical protein
VTTAGQRTDNAEKYSRGGLEGWLLRRYRRKIAAAAAAAGPATILDAGCGEDSSWSG